MDHLFCAISLTVISLGISFIYFYYKVAHSYWTRRGIPQLDPSFPFGDMASVIFRKHNMGDKIKQIYDQTKARGHSFVGLYFFSRKAFLPIDPILIKNILGQDFHYFSDRGIHYDEKNDPISAHLFSLSGPKWKNLRAKLTPAYSPGRLKYMFNTIRDCAVVMTEVLQEISQQEGRVEIKEILARYTTDVIGSCAFGLECNSMRNPQAEFRLMGRRAFTQTVGDVLRMIVIRSFPNLANILGFGVFTYSVTEFFRRVVEDTIRYREDNNVTRNDFLQLLIQLKNRGKLEGDNEPPIGTALTMDEAAAQAFIFFLAGFETTSTTISFALLEMGLHPHIREKARKEVKRVMEKHEGEMTYDAMMDLKYLEMVILETMRKYPPAPVFLRKCTRDYPIPGTKCTIEKGLSVLIPAYGLHRDPEYFPDPEAFDPERFSSQDGEGRMGRENGGAERKKMWDYAYIPFGDGPRNCIGMRFAMIQIKTALSMILQNFEFSLSQQTKLPLKMETKGIILAPIGGIWLDLQRISNK